ncbi:hypothetical protein OAM09_04385 [Candidatus Pelagibacter sp.]|nr:hypothetical protein [Candidatus Pelagibacter sp.]
MKHSEIEIKINELFVYLFVFIFTITLIFGSPFSDDLHHYHAGSILNMDNSKIIIGSNFLHHHYGFSSIWLILHSYLNFNSSLFTDIHVLNGIIFFLILCLLLKTILFKEYSINKINFVPIFLFLFFFLILKYTRLKEFGIDRPGFLIVVYTIYYFLNNILHRKNIKDYHLINLFILTFFIFSIKIIFLPFLVLCLIFLANKIRTKEFLITKKTFIIFIICFSYLVKNLLISGCIIYPIEITCIETLQWNSKEIASNLSLSTEIFNKSFYSYNGNLSSSKYIENFYWFKNWYISNYRELLDYISVLFIACFFTFIVLKKIKNDKLINKQVVMISLILLIFSLLIAYKTPVIRMFHHTFFFLGIIIISISFNFFSITFKKKYFIIFLIICFSFSISKNIKRIYKSNFKNDPILHFKEINWYQVPKKRNLNDFTYYMGWINASPIGNENIGQLNYKKKFSYDFIYK